MNTFKRISSLDGIRGIQFWGRCYDKQEKMMKVSLPHIAQSGYKFCRPQNAGRDDSDQIAQLQSWILMYILAGFTYGWHFFMCR